MKRIFLTIITLICLLPLTTFAKNKVKVYVFEAGGCPYCEQEIEYLESLDSYNEKFTIVKKELYVDHVDWEEGADYTLGYKVANAFNEVGFEEATYQATPFIVISDLYAAAGKNTELESVINEAYEEGDKDIVSCIEKGNDDCLDYLKTDNTTTSSTGAIIITVIICSIILITTYLIKSTIDTNKIIEACSNNNKRKKNNLE